MATGDTDDAEWSAGEVDDEQVAAALEGIAATEGAQADELPLPPRPAEAGHEPPLEPDIVVAPPPQEQPRVPRGPTPPPAQQPPPPMAPVAIQTYAQRCNDPANDPYQGRYEGPFLHFGIPGGEELGLPLRDAMANSLSENPLYFVTCSQVMPEVFRMQVLHRIVKFPALPGQPRDYELQAFGLLGDVVEGQMPEIVCVPDEIMAVAASTSRGAVQVPTATALREHFRADAEAEWGPRITARMDTWRVQTRIACFLPGPLVPFLIDGNRSPRSAFVMVFDELQQRGALDSHQPLLEWLVASCMMRRTGRTEAPMTGSQNFMRAPRAPEIVRRFVSAIREDLNLPAPPAMAAAAAIPPNLPPRPPAAFAPPMPPGAAAFPPTAPPMAAAAAAFQQGPAPPAPYWAAPPQAAAATPGPLPDPPNDAMANALVALAEAITAQRAPAEEKEKTPATIHGDQLRSVLNLTQCTDEEHLPRIFFEVAKAKKGLVAAAIQQKFTRVADRFNLEPPPVTRRIIDIFTKLAFEAPDPDDLTAGLSPFLFLPHDDSTKLSNKNALRAYLDIYEKGTVSMAESAMIDNMEKVPYKFKTLTDVRECLNGFHVFLHTLFEAPNESQAPDELHPFLLAWNDLWQHVGRSPRIWEKAIERPGGAFDIIRWVQVKAVNWAHDQAKRQFRKGPPNFEELFDLIRHKAKWALSTTAAEDYGAANTQATPTVTPTPPPAYTPPRGNMSRPAITPSPQQPRGANHPDNVPNPHPVEALTKFGSQEGRRLRAVMKEAADQGDPLPHSLHTPSVPYCLGWHTQARCNVKCGRAADHVQHSKQDEERLLAWVSRHYRNTKKADFQ
jgi:hypothetical protein